MKIVFTAEATTRLEAQVAYLRDAHAPAAAERLKTRIVDFVVKHLAHFPRTGHELSKDGLWEILIPKTPLLLWYQIHENTVVIVSVWHGAQDRKRSMNEATAEWLDDAQ